MTRVLIALFSALLPSLSLAATTVIVTPGPWDLYRGSSITSAGHATQDACVAAARARDQTRTYTCRTSTDVRVTYTADPVAINCAVSAWSVYTYTAWVTSGSTETRTGTRTRTVVTPASNGGTACPALSETITESRPIVVTPPVAVNCVVSGWSAYTYTAWVVSGSTETRTGTRTRTVTTPASNGGTACPALSETITESRPYTPPTTGGPTLTLNPSTYAAGGYSTIIWDGTGCAKLSDPTYTVWNSTVGDEGGRSIAPNVTTVFTLSCSNGSISKTLTVTGGTTEPPPDDGGGGTDPTPPPTTLPVPTVLTSPIVLVARQLSTTDASLAPVLKYAETARRNWNFEGHVVAVPFDVNQGYWDYENCTEHYADWLFDRPSAWFKLYELTNDASYRALAISDFQYYAGKINASGFFSCKTGEDDTKYLYITPFKRYEALTGDTSYRPVADRIYAQSAQGFSTTYSAGEALWTERELGLHGEAALAYYELTGNQQALARASAMVRQWTTVAGTSGAPQVSYTQHEGGGPGGTQPTNLTNSPWMSAFYFQFARRYWQVTGDQTVLQQASAYFDWLTVNGLYDGSLFHIEFSGVTVPRYLTGELIGDAGYDEGNLLHCPDVQGFVAFAVDAKRRLGLPTTVAEQRLNQLKVCSQRMWANWTRETNYLPKYRIQAPRAWNWWMRGVYEYSLQ